MEYETREDMKHSFKKTKKTGSFHFFLSMIVISYKDLIDTIFNRQEQNTVDVNQQALQQEQKRQLLQEQEIKKLKAQLDDEFDRLIEEQDYAKITFILNKGYELQNYQCFTLIHNKNIKYNETIEGAIENNLKTKFFHTLISSMKSLSTVDDLYEDDDYNKYLDTDDLRVEILSVVKDFNLLSSRVDLKEILQDDTIALEFLKGAKKLRTIYKDIKFLGKIDFDKSLTDYIQYIEKEKANIIEADFKASMDKYSILFNGFDSIKKNITDDIIKNVKNFTENNLPEEARKIIRSIKTIYQDIAQDNLDIQQSLELENLYKKRFPQVIEEYITISPRYREKLKGHNEDPDNLLIDSLHEINTQIQSIFESAEEKKHNKMRVSNTYLKNR